MPSGGKSKQALAARAPRSKPFYIVKAIPPVAAVFWDSSFVPCLWHTLNLTKKFGLKTKNLKSDIVKEYIQKIWASRIMAQLDEFVKSNPDWWNSIAVIFSQPLLKNVKK